MRTFVKTLCVGQLHLGFHQQLPPEPIHLLFCISTKKSLHSQNEFMHRYTAETYMKRLTATPFFFFIIFTTLKNWPQQCTKSRAAQKKHYKFKHDRSQKVSYKPANNLCRTTWLKIFGILRQHITSHFGTRATSTNYARPFCFCYQSMNITMLLNKRHYSSRKNDRLLSRAREVDTSHLLREQMRRYKHYLIRRENSLIADLYIMTHSGQWSD